MLKNGSVMFRGELRNSALIKKKKKKGKHGHEKIANLLVRDTYPIQTQTYCVHTLEDFYLFFF